MPDWVPPSRWSEVFSPEPATWGLRGDAPLWQALLASLGLTAIPADPETRGIPAERELRAAFARLVGVAADSYLTEGAPSSIYVERFDVGGMSGGQVYLPVWNRRLLPLLVSRCLPPWKP